MYEEITENIYRICVTLPKSPLKYLNAYVIKGNGRNLLIDCGEDKDECFSDLTQGLSELGIRMENTDIFLTHMHSDHIGLVPRLVTEQTRVFMSEADTAFQLEICKPSINSNTSAMLVRMGFPSNLIDGSPVILDSSYFVHPFTGYTPVKMGHHFCYGGYDFETVLTAGHTPGHMCLYERKRKILIGGDHVLFGITPNIARFSSAKDSLGNYVSSLLMIRDYDIDLYLPGHREVTGDFKKRIDEIIDHHGNRIQESIFALESHPNTTAYELARYMTWNIRYEGDWSNFPIAQKPFAVYEVAAHLDHLICSGRAICVSAGGIDYYSPSYVDFPIPIFNKQKQNYYKRNEAQKNGKKI